MKAYQVVTPPMEKPPMARFSRSKVLPMRRSARGTTSRRSSPMNFFTATPEAAGVLSVAPGS